MSESIREKHSKELLKIERDIQTILRNFVVNSARSLFDSNPTLESFGWQHVTSQGGSFEKKLGLFSSRHQPDINGEPGKHWDQTAWCQPVIDFLNMFKNELLLLSFGSNCRITINKDLTYKVEHDN